VKKENTFENVQQILRAIERQ